MINSKIVTDKPFLSITYDMANNRLIGDTEFSVLLIQTGDEASDNKTINITHDENLIVTPNSFQGNESRPQVVNVELVEGAIINSGGYQFNLVLNNEYAKNENVISSVVAVENYIEPSSMEYKLKYFIDRPNYRLNIYQNVQIGIHIIPIEINGTVDLSYQDKNDLLEPIISSTLKMKLEASLELTLQDLYFEDEKTYKVELIKEDKIKFVGFLLPDGIWADFVSDKWQLEVTASDGLSSLKNVSFSQSTLNIDGSTINFFGRMTAMQVIDICLKKTGLDLLPIINCFIEYEGEFHTGYNSIFNNIYLSVESYFQNDKNPLDCESILKSILQMFNCTIHQRDGMWVIYRPIDVIDTMTFFRGYFTDLYNYVFDVSKTLGSNINNFEIFHCNENQKISMAPSVQAYQVSYEYGDSKNILSNGGLILEGTGFNIPGWTVNNTSDGSVGRGVRNGYSYGIRHAVRPFNPAYPSLLVLSQSIDIKANSVIKFKIKYRNTGINSLYLNFRFGISGPSGNVYYKIGTGFVNSDEMQRVRNAIPYGNISNNVNQGAGDAIFEAEALVAPIDGQIFVEILKETGRQQGGLFGVAGIEISAASNGNIKSKDYTARRTGRTSTNVKSNVTVYNGDSGSDLFVGTIYKSDSDTPTSMWGRYKYTSNGDIAPYGNYAELLDLNAQDNLWISPKPMAVFEGDFKGHMEYLSVIRIDGIENKKFQFLKWSYSFDNDITKMVLKEFNTDILPYNEYKVDIYENFGNESKVTLVT